MIDPVFHDSRVTLYCGDSRELLPKVEERHGRIIHVMTDPPYSERTHKNARTLKGGDGPKKLIEFASTTFEMIRDIFALANAERWTISFTDNVHAALLEVMPPEGMRHMRTGMWEKPDGSPQLTGDRPAQAHECIVALHPMTASRWNSGGKRGVWTHGVERDIPWHNTPKPVSLCRELITALNVTVQAQILDLMRDLRAKTGAAMLLITHDLGVVAEMCDRVYVMYAGKIVEHNSTAQLFKSPRHPYTQGLLGSTLSLETSGRKLFAIPGSIPSATQMPAGCRFAPRCPIAADPCRAATPELQPLGAGLAACHRLDLTAGDVWARVEEQTS